MKFLTGCSVVEFTVCIKTATRYQATVSVWAYILYAAACRNDAPDDLLWPIVVKLKFVGSIGFFRDIASYVATAYPKLTVEDRVALENAVLRQINMGDGEEGSQAKVFARCLLLDMPDQSFATEGFKDLRTSLNIDMKLLRDYQSEGSDTYVPGGNQRNDSSTYSIARGPRSVVEGPLVECRHELREMVSAGSHIDKEKIGLLWDAISEVSEMIDGLVEGDQHEGLLHESWGLISLAARKIAENGEYSPESRDHPRLDEMLKILDRMAGSKYPEANRRSGGDIAFSLEEDVRVNVSESLMQLAVKFSYRWPDMEKRILLMLGDLDPAVRLPIASQLDKLSDISSSSMWDIIGICAENERNVGVLALFVGGPLSELCQDDERERCVNILDQILQRQRIVSHHNFEDKNWLEFSNFFGDITAYLWFECRQDIAYKWIVSWLPDLVSNQYYLSRVLYFADHRLFDNYLSKKNNLAGYQSRVCQLTNLIIDAAASVRKHALSIFKSPDISEERRARISALYHAGNSLLQQVSGEFYLGFAPDQNKRKVTCPKSQEQQVQSSVLKDYHTILRTLGRAGDAETIFELVRAYMGLAAADPKLVFELLADCMLEHGVAENYHLIKPIADAVVPLVGLYLADYQAIFEEKDHYDRLMGILGAFAIVGCSDAWELIYELPDRLR